MISLGHIMKLFVLLAGAGLMLAGCVSSAENSAARDAAIKDYVACNFAASMRVAGQPGDPVSLGLAAASMCSASKLRYGETANAKFGPSFALDAMDSLERTAVKDNAATIVKYRAGLYSRPAPSIPPSRKAGTSV